MILSKVTPLLLKMESLKRRVTSKLTKYLPQYMVEEVDASIAFLSEAEASWKKGGTIEVAEHMAADNVMKHERNYHNLSQDFETMLAVAEKQAS